MLGSRLLWVQLHFQLGALSWVAFVDEEFCLLPQPAWDPATCWRTHRALVVTDDALLEPRRPRCFGGIVQQAQRLGAKLNLFVRLDFYADVERGPLIGEITV